LIGSMDDAIDQMQKTAKAIQLFEVERFEPSMQELGKTIVTASHKVGELLPMLRDIKKHAVGIGALAKEIGAIEEHSDRLYDQGLKELFKAHRGSDAMGLHRRRRDLRPPRKGGRPFRGTSPSASAASSSNISERRTAPWTSPASPLPSSS
jgi:hypothetical protein